MYRENCTTEDMVTINETRRQMIQQKRETLRKTSEKKYNRPELVPNKD